MSSTEPGTHTHTHTYAWKKSKNQQQNVPLDLSVQFKQTHRHWTTCIWVCVWGFNEIHKSYNLLHNRFYIVWRECLYNAVISEICAHLLLNGKPLKMCSVQHRNNHKCQQQNSFSSYCIRCNMLDKFNTFLNRFDNCTENSLFTNFIGIWRNVL